MHRMDMGHKTISLIRQVTTGPTVFLRMPMCAPVSHFFQLSRLPCSVLPHFNARYQ